MIYSSTILQLIHFALSHQGLHIGSQIANFNWINKYSCLKMKIQRDLKTITEYNLSITLTSQNLNFYQQWFVKKLTHKKWNFKLTEMNDLCPPFPCINTENFLILTKE